jgi:hypothetical protein
MAGLQKNHSKLGLLEAGRQEAHLFKHQITKRFAAAAAWSVLVIAGTMQPVRAQGGAAAAPKKNYQTGEYELYNAAQTDFNGKNFSKAVTDLDAWKQKVPTSDYADERSVLYIQTYAALKQHDKVLEVAGPMLSKDLDAAFPDPKAGPGQVLAVLLNSTVAIDSLPNATPEQTATGGKAAKMLKDYNRKPEGLDQTTWDGALKQLRAAADHALLTIAVGPGMQALAAHDCGKAQSAFSKALGDYPDNAFVSYQLGQAYMCTVRAEPARNDEVRPKAIYAFIRTLVIDPSVSGTQDPKKMPDILTNFYVNFHGNTDGLDQLKEQAKANPLPPADFTIESGAKADARKQKEFQEKYPQLALWLNIKSQLAGAGGPDYFKSSLEGADVPKLKGTVVEGKPACRSKELMVSVPEPNQQGTAPAVIMLKLDAPLTGKPEAGEIQWKGVPSAFSADPFLLTMDTEKANVQDLKTTPCAPAAAHPAAKKSTTPKKK